MMFFDKDIFKGEVSLRGLETNNEMSKTLKFDFEKHKVTFDVIVRVKEAYSGKEMVQEEGSKEVLDEIYSSFNVYC